MNLFLSRSRTIEIFVGKNSRFENDIIALKKSKSAVRISVLVSFTKYMNKIDT